MFQAEVYTHVNSSVCRRFFRIRASVVVALAVTVAVVVIVVVLPLGLVWKVALVATTERAFSAH